MAPLADPLDLSSSAADCRVQPHGAHVLSWRPAGHDPVLWLSPLARYDSGQAIRGGVPVVFPWFGAGPDGDLSPAHGFARTSAWAVVEVTRTEGTATATLHLDESRATAAAFGWPYAATLTVTAGAELRVRLDVANTGPDPFRFEEALHTYLAVGDVARVRVDGLDGTRYRDQASGAGGAVREQSGPVTFTGEVDRVYASGGEVRLVDEEWGRTLVVALSGAASTIVWNPAAVKAAATADIGPELWRGFVCIEGGNVRDAAVLLEPGQAHALEYAIRVERG